MVFNYRQSTFETCLAVCLLELSNVKISKENELEVINYAMNFSRDNYTIGHLEFISKKLNKKMEFYVDNNYLLNIIRRLKASKDIKLIKNKIDLKLIDNLIKEVPAIIYLDSFSLWKGVHYPHFIIIIKKVRNKYKIFDPWNGKVKLKNKRIISDGIKGLRKLNFSPQIIIFR